MIPLKSSASPIIALLAGAIVPCAFAPFYIWPIQIASLAILAGMLCRIERPGNAFLTGWAYGFASFTAGLYWLYISIHDYGGLNVIVAATAVILLTLFMGLLPGLACALMRLLANRWQTGYGIAAILIFPASWTLFEWVRGWLLTGFPWIVTGYAHTDSPLAGYAPIVGVYGISFIAATVAGTIAFLYLIRREGKKTTLAIILAILIFAFGGGTALKNLSWTNPAGAPIHVRLLQGNVPQEFKFSQAQIQNTLDMYLGLITSKSADLIVTPETAIPIYPHQLPEGYLGHLSQFSAESGSTLALGMPLANSWTSYTNSVIVMNPENGGDYTRTKYRYDKHHLVPFGEFIPTGFRWFVNMMRIPLGDFTRGDELQAPFAVKDQFILPDICYEDIFGEEIAAQIRNEHLSGQPVPTILLNISNIAWFGDTIALPQHLQISQMRALETGRPMLRATNTGATVAIDSKGHVIKQLEPYTQGELAVTVQGTQGLTPYIRLGNLLALVALFLSLIAARILSIRNRR